MKTKILLSIALMCAISVFFITISPVVADFGVVPTVDIPVFESEQKAIVAWNGSVETMIISIDVNTTENSTALRILPLPSNPEKIKAGDLESFNQTQNLIELHAPTTSRYGEDIPGSPGINLTFQEKIGAHNITVVEASDAQQFMDWIEDFLGNNGIEYSILSTRLEPLVVSYINRDMNYINRDMNFFVFDLIELNTSERSVEPIVYQFQTDFLYYPLEISSLASGNTEITLFTLTNERIEKSCVSTAGFGIVNYTWEGYPRPPPVPVEFAINVEELENISSCAAELFEGDAWFTAWRYNGSIEDFDGDFMITASASVATPPTPFLIYGWVNYSTGEPVNNPNVTITNLNTSEVFDAETNDSSNYYRVLTSSWNVSAGNVLHFNVSDNGNVAEFNRSVTQEDINRDGIFDFNVTLEVPEVLPIFDTGKPANPYPSISGTHNGSITPYVTMYNVSKLYTYPCEGTGGHTEYVAFYYPNRTKKIAEGHWNGYVGDWHNISFSAFTMHANHTYYYTIKTGSYPQIHHADEWEAKGGMGIINCTSFVDANGRLYNNWIPAIRLVGKSVKYLPVHNIDTGEDFAKIQDAIDDADTEHGHTITVDPGTYNESVNVTKSLTIKSSSGNPADTIVQAEHYYENTLTVTADYVNISGFTVGGSLYGNAVFLGNANHCNISNNNVGDVRLDSSIGTTINDNLFEKGICIRGNELSHYNTHAIGGNTINGRLIYYYKNTEGIKVPEDAGEVIFANCAGMSIENTKAWIELAYTTDSEILNNTIDAGYGYGIYLYDSSNNTIASNNILVAMGDCIRLDHSSNNKIMNNNITSMGLVLCGIHLEYSNDNIILKNNVTAGVCDIYLYHSNNNEIYLNNFMRLREGAYNIISKNSANIWNSTEKITYTYKGKTFTNYLGNYWDNYNGSDANGDGIGDTPYSINSDADNYPLMKPFENYFAPTEFRDANGRSYNNWIPAIRLESKIL